jgi:hypothetical protein
MSKERVNSLERCHRCNKLKSPKVMCEGYCNDCINILFEKEKGKHLNNLKKDMRSY